jgi:HEAT repeat protein
MRAHRVAREMLMEPGFCIQGVRILAGVARENPNVFAEFVAVCEASDPKVRHYALWELGNFRLAGVPALIQVLQRDDSEDCKCAAESLGRIGPEAHDAVPALNYLAMSADERAREAALNALSCIDPTAYPKK